MPSGCGQNREKGALSGLPVLHPIRTLELNVRVQGRSIFTPDPLFPSRKRAGDPAIYSPSETSVLARKTFPIVGAQKSHFSPDLSVDSF